MMTNYSYFEEKSLTNHQKSCFFTNVTFKKKEKKGRDAGHRSPDWGCTKTTIFNENLWRIKKKGNNLILFGIPI